VSGVDVFELEIRCVYDIGAGLGWLLTVFDGAAIAQGEADAEF
jgi:hypothetical protein